jgi:uncharacterized membrane protein (GlpM family)
MDVLLLALLKAVIAGTFVVAFALLSEAVGPKSFSGIFGAAPSIALASITIIVLHRSEADGRTASFSMIFGARAMAAYCATAVVTVDRYGAMRGSAYAIASWGIVAFACYAVRGLVV